LVDLFGVGWWKYDPDKATEMLEAAGFSKDGSGNWHLPGGSPWLSDIKSAKTYGRILQERITS